MLESLWTNLRLLSKRLWSLIKYKLTYQYNKGPIREAKGLEQEYQRLINSSSPYPIRAAAKFFSAFGWDYKI
jgi:hypothetical protein